MDARQLRYFVQIVESGSLSKAARQLFVVQPALSQQVARLEEEVGRPLLVRSARGVVPTPSGEALYHHAKFVLRQLDEAVLVARREYTDVRGRVTLGLAPSTSNVLGLPLLRHLKAGYPGITLNVVVALPTHLEERARQSQLDVAVLFSRTAASDMVFEPLLDEDVFAIVPAGTALLPPSKMSLTLAELAALPLVMSSPQHNIRRQLTLELERGTRAQQGGRHRLARAGNALRGRRRRRDGAADGRDARRRRSAGLALPADHRRADDTAELPLRAADTATDGQCVGRPRRVETRCAPAGRRGRLVRRSVAAGRRRAGSGLTPMDSRCVRRTDNGVPGDAIAAARCRPTGRPVRCRTLAPEMQCVPNAREMHSRQPRRQDAAPARSRGDPRLHLPLLPRH
jgi:DNA-binding transcriptional LysR family regulator